MKTPVKPITLLLLWLVGCTTPNQNATSLTAGVVSSATPEATEAGMDILRRGGNAVDAAVTVSFVLGVTEPAMTGLGAGVQILMAAPGEEPISINGTTLAPAATPIDATSDDLKYHRRSTVPSMVKTLAYAHKKYGSGKFSWAELIEPAINYAENGFVVGYFRHMVYNKYEDALRKSPYSTGFILMPDRRVPAPGDTIRQPVLAQTLRRLAEKGSEDFYKGEIAAQIAADMTANGGWISLEDLKNFPEPVELQPLSVDFRGYKVYSQPPPCGGWTMLQILKLVERSTPENLQPNTPERLKNLVRAQDLAFENRRTSPVPDLVNYKEAVQAQLSEAGIQRLWESYILPANRVVEESTGGETTHFSVVDKDGMGLAVTSSINAYFGAAAMSPELGFLYNTYMDDFELGQPDHPYAIRPNAMAYSSMSPTIVRKDRQNVLVIGSPGSARIISSVAQLSQLWMDTDLGIERIVEMPRVHVVRDRVYVEDANTPVTWLNDLRKQGYQITFPDYDLTQKGLNSYYGGIHAIAFEKGRWVGAADPRRDGKAVSE